MRVLVVNVSKGYYNLGVNKLRDYMAAQGHDVTCHDGDPGLFAQGFSVCLSVFSASPIARDIALRVKTTVMSGVAAGICARQLVEKVTGLECGGWTHDCQRAAQNDVRFAWMQ